MNLLEKYKAMLGTSAARPSLPLVVDSDPSGSKPQLSADAANNSSVPPSRNLSPGAESGITGRVTGQPALPTESSEEKVLYRNPFPQGSPEAREEALRIMRKAAEESEKVCPVTLADTMDKILRQTINDIQIGGRWKTTPEVRGIESAIDRIYQEILYGSKTIGDFRDVCRQWKGAGTKEPDKEYTGGQWNESMVALIRWFLNATLPGQPFSPSGYEHVLHPEKYYGALKRDIEAGPRGPRSRCGVLQSDLQSLKAYCEGKRVDA